MTADEEQDFYMLSILNRSSHPLTNEEIRLLTNSENNSANMILFLQGLSNRYYVEITNPIKDGITYTAYELSPLGQRRLKNLLEIQRKEKEEEIRSKLNLKFSKTAAIAAKIAILIALIGIIVTLLRH